VNFLFLKFELNFHIILVYFLTENWPIWRMLALVVFRTIQNSYYKNSTHERTFLCLQNNKWITAARWWGIESTSLTILPSAFETNRFDFTVLDLCIEGPFPAKDARWDSSLDFVTATP
jgi:hypothetical protein